MEALLSQSLKSGVGAMSAAGTALPSGSVTPTVGTGLTGAAKARAEQLANDPNQRLLQASSIDNKAAPFAEQIARIKNNKSEDQLTEAQKQQLAERRKEMRQQFEQLLADVFLGQMFKMARSSPFATSLSGGSHAEKTYGALLDQEFGKRMAHKATAGLANSMVKRMESVWIAKNREANEQQAEEIRKATEQMLQEQPINPANESGKPTEDTHGQVNLRA